MKKCIGRRGESLVETLAAILIITLASVVLLTMAQCAAHMNAEAKDADSEFYAQQAAAEADSGTSSSIVTVTGGSGAGFFRQDYGVYVEGSASSGALRAYNPR